MYVNSTLRLFRKLSVLVTMAAGALFSTGNTHAQSCATNELMADTRFIFTNGTGQQNSTLSGLNFNGWVASGSGIIDIGNSSTYIHDNFYTQNFTHAFTGVNQLGSGAILTISAGIRNGLEGVPTINSYGKASLLTIMYGGVAYATITTDGTVPTDGHIATVNYLNGATGSVPDGFTLDYGTSPQDFAVDLANWQIFLPASIPNNGNLVMEFNPGGSSSGDAADDFIISAVSLKVCQISISGNVFNDIDGLTDNEVDNNNGAQPASTLPLGLTANLFNATTGTFVATVNVINGIYTFPNVTPNTNYTVIISNVAATSSSTANTFPSLLPTAWLNNGDVNPTDPIATALTPGISSVIEITTITTDNVNFGIKRSPEGGLLPIKLESFTGAATDCNKVTLNWKVSDAISFDHFQIERSLNGGDFKTLGIVSYDAVLTAYNFNESSLQKGSYQYRLKMVDIDGQFKYSPVIFIKLDCSQQRTLLVYPNPVKEKLTMNGLNSGEQVLMYNASGQKVQNKKATGYQQSIDMTTMTDGIYYIVVINKDGAKVSESKVIKIH